ncbi:ATP-binding protein [bacterium]|nr:ATP-binding protein [bacterium]
MPESVGSIFDALRDPDRRPEPNVCRRHGFESSPTYRKHGESGMWLNPMCPKCREEETRRRESESRRARTADRARRTFDQSEMGAAFAGVTFDTLRPYGDEADREAMTRFWGGLRRWIETLSRRDNTSDPCHIRVVCGSTGVGKTAAQAAAMDLATAIGLRTAYYHGGKLFDQINARAKSALAEYINVTLDSAAQDAVAVDLLLIDDLGYLDCSWSERWSNGQCHHEPMVDRRLLNAVQTLVDKIYRNRVPAIIATNITPIGLIGGERADEGGVKHIYEPMFGPLTARRLGDRARIIPATWPRFTETEGS